jgi:uncharacterized protein
MEAVWSEVCVTGLYLYPVKSCAGVKVDTLVLSSSGVEGDRRYMVVTPEGRFLTQRQIPEMAWIQPSWRDGQLCLTFPEKGECLVCGDDRAGIGAVENSELEVEVWRDRVMARDCGDVVALWLESVLGRVCRLVVMPNETCRQVDEDYALPGELVGFADGFPLLVINDSSLAALALEADCDVEVERFRPNVVVSGAQAYEELQWQRLQAQSGSLELVKPCERCVIPTRNPVTQVRDTHVLQALKNQCRIDGRIIFGQNAIARGVSRLQVGEKLLPCGQQEASE